MNFEEYIGTKRIKAKPMTRGEYNKYRSWITPENENPDDEGYLVKYYPDGYQSWSPKEIFEDAYRKSGEMTFGHALEALKHGDRVARTGWNGKDMYLFLADGKQLTHCLCSKDMPPCTDSICMKTALNTIVIGWLASQTDMLAEDWKIVG
ncbi:MAG: DUF2829 domain-containing protein [Ruminococcus sp.]|nr:DUF2829 domain-containing protein [Ruminococcus sp.]